MARTDGIDVSRWAGDIDWGLVEGDGYKFVSIRSSIGDYYTDPKLRENFDGAQEKDFILSIYHVHNADSTISAQIDRIKQSLDGRVPQFYVADIEPVGNVVPTPSTTRALLEAMEQEFGEKPVVYTAAWTWDQHIGDVPWAADYDLWVVHYYYPNVQVPRLPVGWSEWKLWQYSDKGRVSGIPSETDLDFFDGTLEEMREWAGNGTTPPPPSNLEKRVEELERRMDELEEWARGIAFDTD
ncbi:MAG: hypothetical protein GTO18_16885 [Anaerolineales bacterium]|nr:hypothetical protein [Anaerolineales bacterium]